MAESKDAVLAQVIDIIRRAVDEDWILDFDIDAQTSFNDDLELESIEFVGIAEKIQEHYGKHIGFIEWLSGMKIDQIVALTVGDLADFVYGHLQA
ncbi:acyl carrier protein [Sterolibacterium denitrificans]|nr:acyl carrier protein [Sterolibacterium denitrificans]